MVPSLEDAVEVLHGGKAAGQGDGENAVLIVTWTPASDGDRYDDYYRWYVACQAHIAASSQRIDYPGESPDRSRTDIRHFTGVDAATAAYM